MTSPFTRPRFVLPVLLAAIVALGGLLWTHGDQRSGALEPLGQSSSLELPGEHPGEPDVEVELMEPAIVDVEAASGRRSEIPDSAPAESDSSPVAAAADELRPTGVRILLQPNPWLDGSTREALLRWDAPDRLVGDDYRFRFDQSLSGEVELPGRPTSLDEFGSILVAGLVADAVEWRKLESTGGPEFEVLTEWAEGATLVWAHSVPLAEQREVTVAVGGDIDPSSREAFAGFRRAGLVQARGDLRLPLVLPRLERKESVWVGAAGLEWRAFTVAPETSEVQVALSPAVTIRVLHDGPDQSASHRVFVTAFPRGETESRPITGSNPVVFTERPTGVQEVWVAESSDRQSPRVSRLARFEAAAGETVEVDLTSRYAEEQLGGLRIHVHTTKEVLGLAKPGLSLSVSRRAGSDGGAGRWSRAGEPVLVEDGTAGELVYEMTGLTAGLHRVTVQPFGAHATDEVVVGEVHELNVFLLELGWVDFELPPAYQNVGSWATLTTTEPSVGDRTRISLKVPRKRGAKGHQAVVPGTYRVQVRVLGESALPSLTSDPFTVQVGMSTTVELYPVTPTSVHVVARDAVTDSPIELDLKFWVKVRAVSTTTGENRVGITSFDSGTDACTGITWDLNATDEAVQIVVPENPFWSFDPVEPIRLEGELTVVLRGRAK